MKYTPRTAEQSTRLEKTTNPTRKTIAAAGILTLALYTGGCSNQGEPLQPPVSTESSPINPSTEHLTPALDYTIEVPPIPAGLEHPQLAQEVLASIVAWEHAGTDDAGLEHLLASEEQLSISTADSPDYVAREYASAFAGSLFVDDWKNYDDLAIAADHLIRTNAANIDDTAASRTRGDSVASSRRYISSDEIVLENGDRAVTITNKLTATGNKPRSETFYVVMHESNAQARIIGTDIGSALPTPLN